MNEEHNMTLIEKWQKNKGPMFVYTETEISDWFLAQFDSMLAEDIEKMSKLFESSNSQTTIDGRIGFREGIAKATSILEARRLSLKK